jgi:hypothetical protein
MKKQTNLRFLKNYFFIFLNRFNVLMLKIILKNKKILFNTSSNKKTL